MITPKLEKTGGITLNNIPLTTSVSIPGGGWYRMGGQVSLPAKVAPVTLATPSNIIVSTPLFTITRSIVVEGNFLRISDTLKNNSNLDQGFFVRHDLAVPPTLTDRRIAGDPRLTSLQISQPAHPTVFVSFNGMSFGLVIEDDIFRAQGIQLCNKGVAGIRTEQLVIRTNSSYTMGWSVYFGEGDYWDFVNGVRNRWGVNQTVNGPYWVTPVDLPPNIGEWLNKAKPYASIFGSWIDPSKKDKPVVVGLGTGPDSDYFKGLRDKIKAEIITLKSMYAPLKYLAYEHRWYDYPDGGFADSKITLSDGSQFIGNYAGKTVAPAYFPTLDNAFGRAFAKTVLNQLGEMGLDGIYLDESNTPGILRDPITKNPSPYTYSHWDGYSAILDPTTFQIKQKIGYLWLLSKGFDNKLFGALKLAGYSLLMNFQAYRKEGFTQRFCETTDLYETALTNLGCPLAFAYNYTTYTVQDVIDRLMVGALYCMTGPGDKLLIPSNFFPITPLKIGAGFVIGKERIITAVSGQYFLTSKPKIITYSADGTSTTVNSSLTGFVQIDVPRGGLVIIIY